MNPSAQPVLLYDGDCGLCNRVVRFLLRLDRRGVLNFTSLQGPLGRSYLLAHGLSTTDLSTLVFVPDWRRRGAAEFRLRTDGVIAALREVGGWGSFLAALLVLFPRPVRDAGYRRVARLRYRLFGPWTECPLPRPEWARRFF